MRLAIGGFVTGLAYAVTAAAPGPVALVALLVTVIVGAATALEALGFTLEDLRDA